MTPEQRTMRARLAAQTLHAQGGTNTVAARAAFEKKFLDEVDPDRTLPESERLKRAEHAKRAHFTALALKSSQVRGKRKMLATKAAADPVVMDAAEDYERRVIEHRPYEGAEPAKDLISEARRRFGVQAGWR